jgi:hypothetical protein
MRKRAATAEAMAKTHCLRNDPIRPVLRVRMQSRCPHAGDVILVERSNEHL